MVTGSSLFSSTMLSSHAVRSFCRKVMHTQPLGQCCSSMLPHISFPVYSVDNGVGIQRFVLEGHAGKVVGLRVPEAATCYSHSLILERPNVHHTNNLVAFVLQVPHAVANEFRQSERHLMASLSAVLHLLQVLLQCLRDDCLHLGTRQREREAAM